MPPGTRLDNRQAVDVDNNRTCVPPVLRLAASMRHWRSVQRHMGYRAARVRLGRPARRQLEGASESLSAHPEVQTRSTAG